MQKERDLLDLMFERETPSTYHNELELWGIEKNDIRQLDKATLSACYKGIKNLPINPDHIIKLLNVSNGDEILAYWIGAGRLKQSDGHKRMSKREFADIIHLGNHEAYENTDLPILRRKMEAEGRLVLPHGPRQLQERLAHFQRTYPDSAEAYAEAFFTDYVPSQKEDSKGSNYPDPLFGDKQKGYYSKAILTRLENLWTIKRD